MPQGTDFTTKEEIIAAITESGQTAKEWFERLTKDNQQSVLSVLSEDADLEGCIIRNEDPNEYTLVETEQDLGQLNENQTLPKLGETREIRVTVFLDEDYSQSKEETYRVENVAGHYYKLPTDEEGKHELLFDGAAVRKKVTFFELLDQACEESLAAISIGQAIAEKNFEQIKRIIKRGDKLDDETLLQMMRLSIIDSETQKAVTFLQFFLGDKGFYDSSHAEPLLKRTKELMSEFEYQTLFELSDKNQSAKDLIGLAGRGDLRAYAPKARNNTQASNAQSDINTHQQTVHESVDISAAKVFARFHERYPSVVPASTTEEKGKININNEINDQFSNFIDEKILALKNELDAWLALSDERLTNSKIEKAKLSCTAEDLRFQLEAAKRLVDACIDPGEMTGVGHNFKVPFNTPLTLGITLKEALAMTYDALSDKKNYTNPGNTGESDKIGYFYRLVEHLYQTKREYNNDNTIEGRARGDDNKCQGGSMNHIMYSLQGINNLVDIVYVDPVALREEVSYEASRLLRLYLAEATSDADKAMLKKAILRSAMLGVKITDLLTEEYKAQLTVDIRKFIKQNHDNHYKNEDYLNNAENFLADIHLNKDIIQDFGEVKYPDLVTAEELSELIKSRKLPLYTKTDKGYVNTLALIAEQDREFYEAVVGQCLSKSEYAIFNYLNEALLQDITTTLSEYGLTSEALDHTVEYGLREATKILIESMTPEQVAEQLSKQDNDGMTALHHAARNGHTEIAKLLISVMTREQVAEQLSKQDNLGMTALHYTTMHGRTELAKLLIDKMTPEQLALKDNLGKTALDFAVQAGHTEVAIALINATPSEEFDKNNIGSKLLFNLIRDNKTEVAEALIAKLSEDQLALQDSDGMTALHHATIKSNTTIIESLVRKTPEQLALKDNIGNTTLHIATNYCPTEVVALLISLMNKEQLAEQLFKQNNLGMTALHRAAKRDSAEIAKLLISLMNKEQLAEQLSKQDNNGMTALHTATMNGRTEIAKLLISLMNKEQLAEQLSKQDNDGRTALHTATMNSGAEIAKLLISVMKPEQVAEQLSKQDNDGRTALHTATRYGNTELAELLISVMTPEQVALKDNRGRTALDFAVQAGHTEVALTLINATPSAEFDKNNIGSKLLFDLIKENETEVAEALIAKLSEDQLALQDSDGMTALHRATMKSNAKIIESLVRKMTPEQLYIENNKGETAFDFSLGCGETGTRVFNLVGAMTPAQLEWQDKTLGRTFLHRVIAVEDFPGRVLHFLITKMTPEQLALKDQKGRTALHYVLQHRSDYCRYVSGEGVKDIRIDLIAKMNPSDLLIKPPHINRVEWELGSYAAPAEIKRELSHENIRVLQELHELLNNSTRKPNEVMELISTGYELSSLSPAAKLKIANYLNDKDKHGITNFRKIIKSGNEEMIRVALDYGADFKLAETGGTQSKDVNDRIRASLERARVDGNPVVAQAAALPGRQPERQR